MFGALFRMEFPLGPGGIMAVPKPRTAPKAPDLQQLNRDKHSSD